MSTLRRLAAGNLATLMALVVNVGSQLFLTPLYLRFWSPRQFGLWLVLNAVTSLLGIVDIAHQDYLGFECMKLTNEDRKGRTQILSDAIPVLATLGVAELALLGVALTNPIVVTVIPIIHEPGLEGPFRASLLFLMAVWIACQNFAGVVGRVLSSFGYFATSAWWSVAANLMTSLAPALAVALGAGLFTASLVLGLTTVLVDLLIYRHYWVILKIEGLTLPRSNARAGLRRYRRALLLAIGAALEYAQQTGFRLVALPLLGVDRLVKFSTLRTLANTAQQGIGTLMNPSIPELMRYVAARDGNRVAAMMIGVSVLAVVVISPGLVLLQFIAEAIFPIWTAHKIPFDGPVFAALSSSVLIYGLSQSSRALVRGNNLVLSQIIVSLVSAAILVLAAIRLTPSLGMMGAALALCVSELIRSVSNITIAARWVSRLGLNYPYRGMMVSAAITAVTIVVIASMSTFSSFRLYLGLAYAIAWPCLCLALWISIGDGSREILRSSLSRLIHTGLRLHSAGMVRFGK